MRPATATRPLAGHLPGTAVFSGCGRYRYLLARQLPGNGGICLFIMLNPSTADAQRDDPTITRCKAFAGLWGMSELRVVNLFGLVTSDPRQLALAHDPVGPGNDEVLVSQLRESGTVIAAWGNCGSLGGRSDRARRLMAESGASAYHLGLNISGEPRHPLYVNRSTVPSPLR